MLLPKRIWRDIEGFEGLYQVSNTGQVRSLGNNRSRKTKILKQYINNKGYKQVGLRKNGKCKKYLVHRLVAQAFIPNPNNYPIINHKDENPSNNAVWNLEWCTYKHNINYGTRNKKASESMKGKNKGKNNPTSKPVLMFSKNGEFIKRFDNVADANEYLGKDRDNSNINRCARGKYKTAYNYLWKYEMEG